MPEYGTSQQQIELMRQIELSRMRQSAGGRRQRNVAVDRAIDRYMDEEYERQRGSSRGQWLQKKMTWPGMAATMAARTQGLEQKVGRAVTTGALSKVPRGGLTPEELTQQILNVGGAGYLATSGLANVSSIKRRAAQRQYEQQLGGLGKAERVVGNLSALNRVAAQMRVASLVAGEGMGRSVQGGMGLYGSSMTGMLPFMGAQIGLAIWKQARIKKIKAQRTPGGEKAAKIADPVFNTLDEQASILQRSQGMKPGEGILYQALRFIGTQVAVNPLIYEELAFIREEREKGRAAFGEEYGEGIEGENERDVVTRVLDKTTGFLDKTLAKYDFGTQLFNFLTTGQLPRTLQKNLEAVWERQGFSKQEIKSEARSRGISMDQHRLGLTTSRMLVEMAPNVQMQEVALLSGIFDTNRYILLETEMIRRGGFGVQDTERHEVEYRRSAMGRVWESIKEGAAVITNIPGINAVANLLTLPFRMPAKVLGGFEKVIGGISNVLLGGRTADLLSSEEELQKAAGIYRSTQEAANEFMAQGLPNIQEDLRVMGAVRAQLLTNIYQVQAKHLELATGQTHTYDSKPFAKELQKGSWSMTAGKYLSARGAMMQEERDRERMEVALERSFRGSFSDIMGWMLTGGRGGIQRRLRGAVRGRQRLEMIPWLRTEAAETFDPQALMSAAMFRQRGIRNRDVGEAQFFSADLERRMMQQENLLPRMQRMMGRGVGGFGALGGGALGLMGALTGGLGIPLMALLGLGGMGLGAIAPAGVRTRQMEEVFRGYEGSAEQFLGVRGRKPTDLTVQQRARIIKEVGPVPPEWFKDPANQSIIASILQTPDVEDLTGGTFAGGPVTGVAGGVPKAISALGMSIDQLKKDPLPVIVYGYPGTSVNLPPGVIPFRTRGKYPGSGRADDYSDPMSNVQILPLDGTTGQPLYSYDVGGIGPNLKSIAGGRSLIQEQAELEEKKEKDEVTYREKAELALSEQSLEFQKKMSEYLRKISKNINPKEKEGLLGKLMGGLGSVFGPILSAFPLLLGALGLGGISALTGGAVGTKGMLGLAHAGVLKAGKGLATAGKFGAKMLSPLTGLAGKGVDKIVGTKALDLGIDVAETAGTTAVKSIGKLSAKAFLKSLIKKIPFVGAAFGLYLGVKRMLKGDWLGGIMEIGSGLASMLPGIGTAASVGIDVLIAGRDIKNELENSKDKTKDPRAVGEGLGGFVGQDIHPITGMRLTEEQKRYRERLGYTRWMNVQEQMFGSRGKGPDSPVGFAYGGVTAGIPKIIGEDGPEAGVPLTPERFANFLRKIDPNAARNELAQRVMDVQEETKLEVKERTNREELAKITPSAPAMPTVVPIDTSDTGFTKDKSATRIDDKLDKFLTSILSDCSFEFSNRYKRYVYDSNTGFSFA